MASSIPGVTDGWGEPLLSLRPAPETIPYTSEGGSQMPRQDYEGTSFKLTKHPLSVCEAFKLGFSLYRYGLHADTELVKTEQKSLGALCECIARDHSRSTCIEATSSMLRVTRLQSVLSFIQLRSSFSQNVARNRAQVFNLLRPNV